MTDEWYSPNHKPRPPRQRQPGEQLFAFLRGHDRFLCELRDDGEHGVDAQFWVNEEFLYSQRFNARPIAITWATSQRAAIEKGGK